MPHVIARAAVPVILMMSFCPSVGVPERLVVKLVMSATCAVRVYISTLSVLIVGVVDEVVVPTRGVTLLFVNVFVAEIVSTVIPSTEITPAETLAIVVSVACQSSIVVG